MQRLPALVAAAALGLFPAAALCADTTAASTTSVDLEAETIATSNILNDQSRLSDIGLHLRGIVDHGFDSDVGAFALKSTIDLFHYRAHPFANTDSYALELDHAVVRGPVTLKSHVGYAIADQGDDLMIGSTPIELRELVQSFSAGTAMQVALPADTLAQLSVEDRYDRVGKARFTLDLPDTRVTPDRNTVEAALGVAHVFGPVKAALIGEMADVELFRQTPLQNAVPYRSYAIRGRLGIDDMAGFALSGEVGLRRLDDGVGIYDRARLVYALSAARVFAERYSLALRLTQDFDAADTDDPLATYRRRLELEGKAKLAAAMVAGAGIYTAVGDNLLLENRDKRWGAYGALAYVFNPKLTGYVRVDYASRRRTIIDLNDDTLSGRIGLQAQL